MVLNKKTLFIINATKSLTNENNISFNGLVDIWIIYYRYHCTKQYFMLAVVSELSAFGDAHMIRDHGQLLRDGDLGPIANNLFQLITRKQRKL